MTTALSHRESDDTYAGVIARGGRYRVAVCRDGIQWLLQRRSTNRSGARWKTLHYITTRSALIRLWTSSEPLPREVEGLPDQIRSRKVGQHD